MTDYGYVAAFANFAVVSEGRYFRTPMVIYLEDRPYPSKEVGYGQTSAGIPSGMLHVARVNDMMVGGREGCVVLFRPEDRTFMIPEGVEWLASDIEDETSAVSFVTKVVGDHIDFLKGECADADMGTIE